MPFGSVLTWEGIPVAPGFMAGALKHDMTGYYAERHGSDLVLVLLDVFNLNADLAHLRSLPCPAAWWFPVDCAPLGPRVTATLAATGVTPVAMSRFGQVVLEKAGFEDVPFVPHAVDTALFCPPGDPDVARKQARDALGWGSGKRALSEGTFVIGINAANQHPCRKGWFEQLYAYRDFAQHHPDSAVVAWTLRDGRPIGLALDGVAEMLGITDHVIFPDAGDVTAGTTSQEELVAGFYAAPDVVSNCAWSEGFGLVPLEAQACGLPVVVTDFAAMSEVAAPGPRGAWKVPSSPVLAFEHLAATWGRPHLGGIIQSYEEAFAEREAGVLAERGQAAREHALAWDHHTVYEQYWVPVLERLLASDPPNGRPEDPDAVQQQ